MILSDVNPGEDHSNRSGVGRSTKGNLQCLLSSHHPRRHLETQGVASHKNSRDRFPPILPRARTTYTAKVWSDPLKHRTNLASREPGCTSNRRGGIRSLVKSFTDKLPTRSKLTQPKLVRCGPSHEKQASRDDIPPHVAPVDKNLNQEVLWTDQPQKKLGRTIVLSTHR